MSQENVEVVRRCYEAMNARDFSVVPEITHPDFVWDLSRNVFNPAVYRGVDGLRRAAEQVEEMWEEFEIRPIEFIDAGDKVVVAAEIVGRAHQSGVETSMRLFAVWELSEGKVVRFTGGYRDRNEALEAAGLRE